MAAGVPWRFRLGVVAAAFVAVLVAAWVYLPDFKDGVVALWGDGKSEARERLK